MPRSAKKTKNAIIPKEKIEGKEIIQIVFSAKETDRITQSIKESKPTRVYYVSHKFDIYKDFMAENKKTIRETVPKCTIIDKIADFVNYHEIIALIFEIYELEIGNTKAKIMINCGTGSKMVAVACFDAYRLLSKNIELFYPFGKFTPDADGPNQQGVLQSAKPPEFQMKVPTLELIELIQIIYRCCLLYPENDRKKRGFIYMEELVNCIEKKPFEKKASIVKKQLNILRDEWHYIHFDTNEGGKPISFTRAGKQIALALRHYPKTNILDPIWSIEAEPFMKPETIPPSLEYERVEENTLGDFLLVPKIKLIDKEERQVHITYNVDETVRITRPIIESKTQILYYFWMDGEQKDIFLNRKVENIATIKKELPHCIIHEIGVDYVDYYQVISKLAEIIQLELNHSNTKILLNLGTASKMVAMANMDIFRIFPDKIELVYLYSRNYSTKREDNQPKHVGPFFNAMVPRFELLLPDKDLIKSLQLLDKLIIEQNKTLPRAKNEYLQSDWEKVLIEKNLLSSNAKDITTQRVSINQIFEKKYRIPLEEEWNLIRRTESGKSYKIRFKDEGLKFISVFRNIHLTS